MPVQRRDAANAGDSFIHVSQIDLAVECDVPPYEHRSAIGEVERQIGEYVADLVPDGATHPARDRGDPGGHRACPPRQARPRRPHEMFTDSIVDLVEAGVITGAARSATGARS